MYEDRQPIPAMPVTVAVISRAVAPQRDCQILPGDGAHREDEGCAYIRLSVGFPPLAK